jgi:hypothetical protein
MEDPMMRSGICLLACAGALAGSVGWGHAQEAAIEEVEVTTHRSQGEVRPVEGGRAHLLRTAAGIFVNFETEGLTPGNAYTLLIAAINDPAACEGSPCQPPDVLQRTAETKADLATVDGVVVGDDGGARFAAFVPAGALPRGWFGNGLDNPEGAEIHLIVNDHGPLLPEMAPMMVNTYRGGCADEGLPAAFPDSARADGEPGPNTCRLLQVAIFSPERA